MTSLMPAARTDRVRPDIPRAKRTGLELDLEAICAAGPGALEPDDHYRLKTYGVCAQRQDDRFMIRMRVVGGHLDRRQANVVADLAERYADGQVHLTTRQNVELHSVQLPDVPTITAALERVGLGGRSACGHTVRNVMACPESGTSIEEPFDVLPDAHRLSRMLVARSAALNVALPSRLNIVLGGCTRCGFDALINDIGLIARVDDGICGYQLWAGGSLGAAPRLSFMLRPFLRRNEVWPAVWTIVEWFCREGDVEQVARGRLKFVIEARGEHALRQYFAKRFPELCREAQAPLEPVAPTPEAHVERVLATAPPQGWSGGVRPEREAGRASVTIRVPRGDLRADQLSAIVALAPDGRVRLTREQNVQVPSVPVEDTPRVLSMLDVLGLGPGGARSAADIAACPGLTFCSLALTGSQEVALGIERSLAQRPDLPRDLSVAVSGCPNSCAKQQIADVGLTGTKLRLGGRTEIGYHLLLGADLSQGLVGVPVLKLLEREAPDAVVVVLETWAALRRPRESMASTFRRIGLERIGEAIALRLRPEPDRVVEPGEVPG